jgi:hypothetical protein
VVDKIDFGRHSFTTRHGVMMNYMKYDAKTIEKQTGTLSVLSQLLTAVGVVAVLFGIVSVLLGIMTEYYLSESGIEDETRYGIEGLLSGISMFLIGLALAGGGATLKAIRSIAINCARIAEGSK